MHFSRSTRNTRIERLWVEVGTQFARRWRGFFTRLERMHGLDHNSPHHLWLLHYLFLDDINSDCRDFQDEWNFHPLGGTRNKGQSPTDLRFISQTEHGVDEDQPGVHPSVLEEFYGVDQDIDDGWDDVDMDDLIADEQLDDVRHEPVEVPPNGSPFNAEIQAVFHDALQAVRAEEVIPEEFADTLDDYPDEETIHLGRGGKKISVVLPSDIWLPRALLWAQGLELMARLMVEIES
ncbi:hypothetical protein C8J57DRAFT_1044785 [Mycena rebaudengoi]|nr:hypothetical protein C8J57DRAFT_1091137 [Mycena rebaudengoi]KAJ7291382.1 hypothetical protein C8J57DRAFT_1044785 [Mycena rebaudengoi]